MRQEDDHVHVGAGEAAAGRGFKYGYVVYERPSSVANAMHKMDLGKPREGSKDEPQSYNVREWQ